MQDHEKARGAHATPCMQPAEAAGAVPAAAEAAAVFDLAVDKVLQSRQHRFALRVRLQSPSRRVVLLGDSGAGKSMTLRAVAGLLRPDAGHVRVSGRTLFDSARKVHLPAQARRMGYVFQDYALFPHLSVRQNVAFGLRRGWRNPSARARWPEVEHWLDMLGLMPLAHQLPDALSGGQRQRVALARTLVAQPDALLLDEPFSALDPSRRAALRDELDALQQRLQLPMLLITHDADDAAQLGEHVFRLREGEVVGEMWQGATALPASAEAGQACRPWPPR